jgi:hypothetical protein
MQAIMERTTMTMKAPQTDRTLPSGADIVAFQQSCLALPGWPHDNDRDQADEPDDQQAGQPSALWRWIEANHRCNSLLWAEEDLARRTRVSDSEIATNKRNIDRYNQARNDATERVDELLLLALGLVDRQSAAGDAPVSTPAQGARLNSETAGSMIDRLSIMALKVHAMRLQTQRKDVDEAHRQASEARLARLQAQRDDLAACLDELIADARAGRTYFKVYRQFKMYNDARFNPALVAEAADKGQATDQPSPGFVP